MLSSMNKWIFTAKIVLISSGVVSLAMAMRYAVPLMTNFMVYELPTLLSTLLTFFKPPYLYVIINAIIITIVASSRFTRYEPLMSEDQSQPLVSARTPPVVEISAALAEEVVVYEDEEVFEVKKDVVVFEDDDDLEVKKAVVVNGLDVVENEEEVVSRFTYTPPQRIASRETETANEMFSPVTEKPPVSSRFGHKKPLKAISKGKRALKVAMPEEHETLDNTWRMITEGRHAVPTHHFTKSDTFNENHRRNMDVTVSDENCLPRNLRMRKLETFKDRTNYRDLPISLGKITKEPSLSQDELNRRVEDFINKFNKEMRLQKQESMKQYVEMINRGANH